MTEHTPDLLELRVLGGGTLLEIHWSDGRIHGISSQYLRNACRCAHCRAQARAGAGANASSDLRLLAVEHYGPRVLRFEFSDGHGRGLYPHVWLHELGCPGACKVA